MRIAIGIIAVIAAVAAVYFLSLNPVLPVIENMETIDLIVSDNIKIAANLFEADETKGWLILVHMMPATKESWNDFAEEMRDFGYSSLAIDLRGHGKSAGGPNGYQKFSDAEHQAGIKDVEAAWEFLKTKGAVPEKTAVIGASIGANLGLQFLAEHSDLKKAVLLSPGLNYRGIVTLPLAAKLQKDQAVIFATSKDDGDNAADNQRLFDAVAGGKSNHLIIFDKGGHGTNLLESPEYDLTGAIKKFLTDGTIN